jgi:hypothetical protein
MVTGGPLAPWWSADVEGALLPLFAVGPDGLARARLPFAAHMAIVDDLLDSDLAALLPDVRCPAWLVSCEPVADGDPWALRKAAAWSTPAACLPVRGCCAGAARCTTSRCSGRRW